jgi:hypothetical protein
VVEHQPGHAHLHLIATVGCFSGSGTFTKAPCSVAKDLEALFCYGVLKMLKAEGKISARSSKICSHRSAATLRSVAVTTCGPTGNNEGHLRQFAGRSPGQIKKRAKSVSHLFRFQNHLSLEKIRFNPKSLAKELRSYFCHKFCSSLSLKKVGQEMNPRIY